MVSLASQRKRPAFFPCPLFRQSAKRKPRETREEERASRGNFALRDFAAASFLAEWDGKHTQVVLVIGVALFLVSSFSLLGVSNRPKKPFVGRMISVSNSLSLLFRFSSWSNRLIGAKDHAAVQINIGHLDESGLYTGKFTTFAIGGSVRHRVSPR